jgi:hypothetical protein
MLLERLDLLESVFDLKLYLSIVERREEKERWKEGRVKKRYKSCGRCPTAISDTNSF